MSQNTLSRARFAAIGAAMGRHPARFSIAAGLAMAALAVAAFGFHPNFDLNTGSASATAESTVWNAQLLRGEPAGATEPSDVYLRSATGAPLAADELSAYRDKLAAV